MFTDSVDQEFRQDTAGCVFFPCSATSEAGKLKTGNWNHLKTHSLWQLLLSVGQEGSSSSPYGSLLVISPNGLVCASLCEPPGFPRACIPKRESQAGAVLSMTQPGNHGTSFLFPALMVRTGTSPPSSRGEKKTFDGG